MGLMYDECENFLFSFNKMIENEGGYILHKNKGDKGGWTYAGITERFWPDWEGWVLVKSGADDVALTALVKKFYKRNFWNVNRLDQIDNKIIAYSIFDFGVNAGVKTSAKLAQIAANVSVDGIIGKKSISALNYIDQEEFEMKFALAKISRYTQIVDRDRSQERFLRGWIKRTLKVLAE